MYLNVNSFNTICILLFNLKQKEGENGGEGGGGEQNVSLDKEKKK